MDDLMSELDRLPFTDEDVSLMFEPTQEQSG